MTSPLIRTALALLILTASACADATEPAGPDGSSAGAQETSLAGDDAALPRIDLVPMYSRLKITRPVFVTHDGAHDDRLYVVEQYGRILVFDQRDDVSKFDVFLDIEDLTYDSHNEEGLLGLAFHPGYESNGRFYVYHSANEPRRGVIAEYRVSETEERAADPASRRVILEVEQPWGNHNGCTLLFGGDGYLYASLGDGGMANDPLKSGQDLGTLLGSIIRLDVDRQEDGKAYAIPADNPFVAREGARPEIWAYGLRNVWRMSFDRETGDLWAGDVGQNRWEEIDLITKGGNYGWNYREGKHEFRKEAPQDNFIEPIVEYGRRKGISITGGYVYRGTAQPALVGVYLYADYFSGRIWGLRYEDGAMTGHDEVFERRARPKITSFGEDHAGEVYVCTFDQLDRRGSKGRIMKVVARD